VSSRPPEFFSAEELAELAGSPQRSRQIAWLRKERIAHTVSLGGDPLVYRDKLYTGSADVQNAPSAQQPDFNALDARRPTARREEPRPAAQAKAAALG
jgi:hypothetical protein